ncbi:DNA binding protein [Gordonia phage Madeline]|uniref:DNA binding protein n=1 Tax=Gordonia phage Madeline TaxID=2591189 RepID=A0A514A341_9CAUD|nr:DNA binding protein [Gordonia phage Madeline]QDH47636.1 DNA binding protein [Gordonia phage Madeline]
MTMPRTTEEILAHADELASRFENDFEPTSSSTVDALDGLSKAVVEAANAEKNVRLWVEQARTQGKSWGAIGGVLGTTGEAARQRYTTANKASPQKTGSTKSAKTVRTGRVRVSTTTTTSRSAKTKSTAAKKSAGTQ